MENKKTIMVSVIIATIVLNGILFYVIIKSKQVNEASPLISENKTGNISVKSALNDSKIEDVDKGNINKKMPQRCVWGSDDSFIPYVVYFDGGTRMRSETRIPQDPSVPEKGRAYEILDKGLHYEWDSSSLNGRKENIPLEEGYTYEESFASLRDDVTGDSDYKCKPWKIDENIFLPPLNVNFINVEEESRKTTPIKCIWDDDIKHYESYFSGDWRMYDSVKLKSSGEIIYRMYDGKWIYQWTLNAKEGIKMEYMLEDAISESVYAREEVISASKHSCQEWVVDESFFVSPTDVQFVETK